MTFDSAQQLVSCYETLGLSPEDIAQSLGLELAAVKAGLMQHSALYRNQLKQEPKKLDFTDDELEIANRTILDLMQFSDNEIVRARLARYVRDDKKGRLEPVPTARALGAGLNLNFTLIQQHMAQVEEVMNKTRTRAVIDIPSREAKMLEDAKNSNATKAVAD